MEERLGFQPLGIKKTIKTQKKRLGNFLEFQKRLGNFIGNVSNIRETAWKRFGGVSIPTPFPNRTFALKAFRCFRSFRGTNFLRDYGVTDDDYEGPPVFDDDQYEEELIPVYDTAIEDVIEEKEGFVGKGGFGEEEDNIEDVVVVKRKTIAHSLDEVDRTMFTMFSSAANSLSQLYSQALSHQKLSFLSGERHALGRREYITATIYLILSFNHPRCHEPNSEGSGSAWKAYMNAKVAGLFLLVFLEYPNGIAPVEIIDRQLPFEYTIVSRSTDVMVMEHPAQNINHSAFRSMFEFFSENDWFRQLKPVLRVEKKMYVIEQPIPPAPATDSAVNVLAEWNAVYDAYNEVACLMLGTEVERFDLIQAFHACKQEKGKPVGQYVLKMKRYVKQLERLGYVLLQDLSVGLILNGFTSDFAGFVLPKRAATPQVMAIQGGRIQKANKISQKAKGKGKGKGKGKDKSYIPKPKNFKPSAKDHLTKNDVCHHCKEVGHWKKNCHVYLAELMKNKKQVGTVSSLDDEEIVSTLLERDTGLLGLIHTDVCGPLRHVSRQCASYFITFTYDYSRYSYIYLLKHKHEVFETFKVFKNKVETQLGKTIKALRSDQGGEYLSQEFKEYLTACGIVQHLTPPYTPQHNGVSERMNRTLLDMVRSMMSLTNLSLSFWDYALESTIRILNMVPTKKVDKTHMNYGYPKETMGYYFYFPPENKIVVARYAEFFKKNLLSQEVSGRARELEEIQDEDTSPSENTSKIPMGVEGFEPPHEEEALVRRSARTHRAPERLCLNVEVEEHSLRDLNELDNYKDAMLDLESNKWIHAMNAEMQSMKDNQTDMDDNVHTYKARLVAKGFTQLYAVDHEETFSPIADIRAIRIVIAIATFYDYEIWKIYVKTAFLNGYLDEDIYMVQSEERLDLNKIQGASTPGEVKRMQNVLDASAVGERHWTAVKTILKYLRNANDMFLVYGGNSKAELRVDCYCDAGFETERDDTKFQIGYVFILNGGAVNWKSTKQSTTAMSITEAEYIAASEAAMEAVWIRKLISGLGTEEPESKSGANVYGSRWECFRYDPDYLREQFTGLVIQRALPFNHFDHEQTTRVFQNTMQPRYIHVNHSTLKRDAMILWLVAKQEIIDSFGNLNACVNLTTDICSAHHGVPGSYMCVTAHWIEAGTWQMMKRVISFEEFSSPHTGHALFKMLLKVLTNFNLEDKVISITLDNASNNTSTMDKLKLKYDPPIGDFLISSDLEFFYDGFASKSKSYFKESLEGSYNLYYAKYDNPTQSSQASSEATSSKASGENNYSRLLNGLKAHTKKARNDPTMSSEFERYDNSDFVTHLHPKEFATFDVLGATKAIPLSDEEIALDASSEGGVSPGGSRYDYMTSSEAEDDY
nr:hypothetical protein [Tanacetum cinerariifolium]